GLWLLGESLQLKDRSAPPPLDRQLCFVGRVAEEPHARVFRDLLERALEATHTKIANRLDKRKHKESGGSIQRADGSMAANGQAPPGGPSWQQPPQGPHGGFWGSAHPPAGAPYEGYQAYHPPAAPAVATGAAWGAPVASAPSVFEDASAGQADGRATEGDEKKRSDDLSKA
ncbi:unnamed protein product, partial [Polarella glacialis]